MLGRYQKNHGKCHWEEIKKALRYLQGIKDLMLMYKKSDAPLEIVGYSDSEFTGCLDTKKWSYIVEKLQTNCHYIFDDVREVCWFL
jgi:hypothetical protein